PRGRRGGGRRGAPTASSRPPEHVASGVRIWLEQDDRGPLRPIYSSSHGRRALAHLRRQFQRPKVCDAWPMRVEPNSTANAPRTATSVSTTALETFWPPSLV